MRSNQITIKDIARELGVSPSTVSRALKDHPDISVETKNAVMALATKYNYQPNAVALSLKNSKRFTIGVIIPETVHYFFSTVISGIEDVAYEAGYNVIIAQSNERYDRELSNSQMLYSNRVDGLMVSLSKDTRNFNHLKFYQDNNIPIVFFDRTTDAFPADQVVIDDYQAAYDATKYLLECGYTNLAHLSAPQNLKIGYDRLQGFIKALNDFGMRPNPRFIIQADNYKVAQVKVQEMINAGQMPDGIFAVNDLTALGTMHVLKKNGFDIPNDVGVVGFSNGQYSYLADPPLTTIDQNGYLMGKTAAKLLLKRINEDLSAYQPQTHVVDTQLIVRESTKKPM